MVLCVSSEAALLVIERKLARSGIKHVSIREPDEPHCGALTAIGIMPVEDRTEIRKLFSGLQLYGKMNEIRAAV